MNKKQLILMTVTGAVTFGAGLFIGSLLDGTKQNPSRQEVQENIEEKVNEALVQKPAEGAYISADVLQVRVNDGDVEWYDGVLWHRAASMEELQKEDKFYAAGAAYQEFAQQMRQEEAAMREQDSALIQELEELSVWQEKKPDRPAKGTGTGSKPASGEIQPPVEPVLPPVQQPEQPSGGASDDSSGGGNDTPAPPPVPTPEEPPVDTGGSDTGDGENMEWSDDYL